MGLDFYTGLNAVPGDDLLTDNFNKTAINSDNVYQRLKIHSASIGTSLEASVRSLQKATITGSLPSTFGQTPGFLIPLDTLAYDSDGFWNPNEPERLSVPPNFTYAQIFANGVWDSEDWQMIIRHFKSGGTTFDYYANNFTDNKYYYFQLFTPKLAVTAGDYFQLYMNDPGSGSVNFDYPALYWGVDYDGSLTTRTPTYSAFGLSIRGWL